MYPISVDFQSQLRVSHRSTVQALVTDPVYGEYILNLPVLSGSVTVDATQSQRRTCNIVVSGADSVNVPTSVSDALTPFVNELRLYRGIVLPSGVIESVPLGVFAIIDVEVNDTGASLDIAVRGADRAFAVQLRKLTSPYAIAAGTNVATVVQSLVSRQSGLQFNLSPTDYTVPAQILREGADPWAEATRIAADAGFQLYFDVAGVCVMAPIPVPAQIAPIWDYSEDWAGLSSIKRRFTRQGVYNDVIYSVETAATTAPIRVSATDTNPSSPTYIDGGYGDVPMFVRSTLPLNSGQAMAAATNALQQSLGLADQLELTTIPNPAFDAYDVISVSRKRMGLLSSKFIADALRIPLTPDGKMDIVGRKIS